jgi:hypothetical protein
VPAFFNSQDRTAKQHHLLMPGEFLSGFLTQALVTCHDVVEREQLLVFQPSFLIRGRFIRLPAVKNIEGLGKRTDLEIEDGILVNLLQSRCMHQRSNEGAPLAGIGHQQRKGEGLPLPDANQGFGRPETTSAHMHIQTGNLRIGTFRNHAVHQCKPALQHLGGIKSILGGNAHGFLEPREHLLLVE